MLPQSNARRQRPSRKPAPAAARLRFLALAIALILGPVAAAADLPPPAESIAVHRLVRDWVAAWSAPAPGDPPPDAVPAVWGASVTLRLDGRIIARAGAFTLDGPSPAAVVAAAGAAVREARSKLPVENDALADQRLAELADRVTVSLELYGEPVPVPEEELALPMAGCSPGAEAIVVSVASENAPITALVSGVDAQLTRGVDPAREMAALAAEITGDGATALRPVSELLAAGFRFHRAPVVHLAMPYENAAPVFLDRGARRIAAAEVRTASLRRFADGVAAHLRGRTWPGVERYGLGGDLNIVTGRPEPMTAGAFQQALAAYALLRHAAIGGSHAGESRDAAESVLRDLAAVEPVENTPWAASTDAAMTAAALSMLAPAEIRADPELEPLRVRVLDTLRRAFDPDAGTFAADVPPAARGLIAWAMLRAAPLDDAAASPIDRERASAAVRAAFRDTPPGELAAQAPFLMWAELELHPEGDLPAAAALDQMRLLVWDHQLRRTDLRPIDQDLAGGVVFTRGVAALPTWQTMRPLAALAAMLGDERLTPGTAVSGQVPGELVRVTEGLRFVRQLALTGDALFLARRADQAVWGVRPAVWQPVAGLEPASMALLTVCETLESMGSVAARATPAAETAQPE